MTHSTTESTQIFRDAPVDGAYRMKWWASRVLIYGLLIFWAIVLIGSPPRGGAS